MNRQRSKRNARSARAAASAAALWLAAAPVLAQDAGRPPTGTVAADPNPYYLGVSQGFTHDTNVYRIPSGPSDNYSSTSVFGGFDQPISRQRLFGRAGVSLNRYQDQTQLNNTSYDLSAGAILETVQNISGNLNVGLTRNLVAPAASIGVPGTVRNLATTERIDSRLRWGGPSLLTLEGGFGYTRLDYSAPAFVSLESRQTTGSLGLYYRPGAFLRVGVAGRYERTNTPNALLDPATGYQSNNTTGRNLDLLADYTLSAALKTNARLSYTHQTNSSFAGADFSGLTGSLAVNWQPTAKTGVQLDVSRDAGFQAATSTTQYLAVQTGTGLVLTPISARYENNRVTNSAGLGLTYEATAKISAKAQLRYTHAQLASPVGTAGATGESTDVLRAAMLGVNYAITRAWGASCTLAHETRDVSGVVAYAYKANTVGCATQFVWR